MKLKTGIEGLDKLVGGGIESGSRNILYGPPGTGKTVFAMQFLWQGLREGETVAFDVMDKPFPRLIAYFKSFGWDVESYLERDKLIAIQAFPHFAPYPKDQRVIYFDLEDFEDIEDAEFTEEPPLPEEQPGLAKALAWGIVVFGGLYILNPIVGGIDLVPDAIPFVGNLDDAAVMFLMFGAMRYLGMRLPEFIERWARPLPQLPAATDPEQE